MLSNLLIKEIKDDILRVTREILEHIQVIYKEEKIGGSEYNEFCVVINNLTLYLCQEVDKLSEVEMEVSVMVKTFYDPTIDQNATLRTKRGDILELLEEVGSISVEAKKLVEKEEDLEVLRRWLKIAARVNSIDEFINKATLN